MYMYVYSKLLKDRVLCFLTTLFNSMLIFFNVFMNWSLDELDFFFQYEQSASKSM